MKTQPSILCLVDNHRGVYIPQTYAKRYRSFTTGVSDEAWADLIAGPHGANGDNYWEAWNQVLSDGIFSDDKGYKYRLIIGEGAGDVFAVPVDWIWSDWSQAYVPPESDTLRRYILPSHWASSIFNGDESGLEDEESKAIDAFIRSEGLQGWTEADVQGQSFTRNHDAPGVLACDCSEYTFIRIP